MLQHLETGRILNKEGNENTADQENAAEGNEGFRKENPLEFLYIKSSLPYLKHQLKDPIPSFKVHFSKPIGIAVRIERDILRLLDEEILIPAESCLVRIVFLVTSLATYLFEGDKT